MKNLVKLIIFVFLTCILYLVSCICLFAGNGTHPMSFLQLDINARPAAMGGAFCGVSDDVNSLIYNPAGLGSIEKNEITFMQNIHFQEVYQEYLGFCHEKGFGIGINYLTWGRIQRTTLTDPDGSGLGKFGIYDLEVKVSYGKKINKDLNLGLSLKFLQEKIDRSRASGGAVDIGILYEPSILGAWTYDRLKLGLTLQNLGTKVKYKNDRESLPLNLKIGAGYQVIENELLLALDLNKEKNKSWLINFGAEYRPFSILALRTGYNDRNEASNGLTYGAGFKFGKSSLDYAFSPYGDLGNTHRISIGFKF